MSGPIKCVECGGTSSSAGARFCEFCGKPLPRPSAVTSAPRPVRERIEWLEASPNYASVARRTPDVPTSPGGSLRGIFGGLVFAAIATGMVGTVVESGAGFMALFPALFVAVGLGIAIRSAVGHTRYVSAELETFPAVVVDEDIEVSGGGRDRRSVTSYFASLERKDGRRTQFRVSRQLAGQIAPGDLGVAFTKDQFLIGFERVVED